MPDAVGGIDDDTSTSGQFTLNAGGHTVGHSMKSCNPHASVYMGQNAFAIHATDDLKGIPADVVKMQLLHIFRKKLDFHWGPDWSVIPGTD